MVDSANPNTIPRNIIYALRRVRMAIEQNTNCTNRMLQGVQQQLRRIYLLVANSNSPTREFNRLLNNLERWVVQWENRQLIDDEIRDLRTVFQTTLDWWNEQDRQSNPNITQEYINNTHLINEPNLTVPQILREAVQQQQH